MMTTSSPGKIILFGEHAVVYDKLGIACSIDKRCNVKFSPSDKGFVLINSKNLNISRSLKEKELFDLYKEINVLIKEKNFDKIKEIYKNNELIPSFFVLSSIFQKYGFKGLDIEINSQVPKNLGSSSSVFSAISLGALNYLTKDFSKKDISDFAYNGDVIAHGGTPSGIDNNAVTFGGYVKYKKSEGVKPLTIDFEIPLLIVDSDKKVKTSEMVSFVRKQREENPQFVNSVLNSLDNISKKALDVLISRNLDDLGVLMTQYYKELKKLDISIPELDKIAEIALENNALGVKPTGAWGGGCCLILTKDKENILNLKNVFSNNGFKSFQAKIGVKGVEII